MYPIIGKITCLRNLWAESTMGNSRQTLYSVVITGFWNILSRRNLHIVAKEWILPWQKYCIHFNYYRGISSSLSHVSSRFNLYPPKTNIKCRSACSEVHKFSRMNGEIFSGSNQLICLQNVFSTLLRLARDFE